MKKWKKILIIALSVLAILVLAVALLFGNAVRTVLSLETYEAKDLYSITYYGDYGFSDFLKTGAKDWKEYDKYIRKTLVHGIASNIDVSGTQCASFIARNPEGDVLFGRNFDYTFAPVVMTATAPSDGYAVLGASQLGFLNFGRKEKIVPHALNIANAMTLMCPYFMTDGMNEYGVAMSVLDCGSAYLQETEGSPTMVTCSMIRAVLENSRNVEEAIEVFKSFNISKDKPNHHFMIADSSGRAVVMEYTKDGTVAVETNIVTNFDLYDPGHRGSGQDRYRKIESGLEQSNGILTEEEVMHLLALSGVPGKNQYSVLYNLTTGEVRVMTHGDEAHAETFHLRMR